MPGMLLQYSAVTDYCCRKYAIKPDTEILLVPAYF